MDSLKLMGAVFVVGGFLLWLGVFGPIFQVCASTLFGGFSCPIPPINGPLGFIVGGLGVILFVLALLREKKIIG